MAAKLAGRVTPAMLIVLAAMSLQVDAHIAAWAPGMYCVNVSRCSSSLFDVTLISEKLIEAACHLLACDMTLGHF